LNDSTPALGKFLWEFGVLGTFLFLLFFYFIFDDARRLAVRNGFAGTFAVGWGAVVPIIIVSLPYKNFMIFAVLGCLFWYFSGYICAKFRRLQPAVTESNRRAA